MKPASNQQGFTMIELMISMIIGLLIVAAVTQIYVMAVRTGTTQRAAAGILDANVYGLQHMEKSMRMAGLGLSDSSKLNVGCSGVLIFQTAYNPAAETCFVNSLGAMTNPYTTGFAANQGTLPTTIAPNTTSTSMPQLTIQYRAPTDMRDCEGRLALGPRKAIAQTSSSQATTDTDASGNKVSKHIDIDGQVIVERYFVTKTDDGKLQLRCDAGRYILETITQDPTGSGGAGDARGNTPKPDLVAAVITGAGNRVIGLESARTPATGSLIIEGIDDFQVRFGVKNTSGEMQYLTPNDIVDNANTSEIVSIQMAVLAKGLVATPSGDVADNPSYEIFGNKVTIKSGQNTNFIRRVYESNTMLRNSRGTV